MDLEELNPPWAFRPSVKHAAYGVVRTVPPAETVRRVEPLLATMGVTRLADVTGLDRVGIPNFTTVRPREPGGGISYYNGKGCSRADAKAGALMEALERYSAERCDLPVLTSDAPTVRALGPLVEPADLVVPAVTPCDESTVLEWVEGFDLLHRRPTYLPLNAVVCPYRPPPGRPVLFCASSNGLASGNTVEEAVCHALCEVVERDATALASAVRDLVPAVDRLLAELGLDVPDRAPADDRHPLVDLGTLPQRARVLADRLTAAGLRVYLRDMTATAGVTTLDCVVTETLLDGRQLVHGGAGCHPDARVAATRALSEAAQSRVSHIQGGREDLPVIVGDGPARFDPDQVYGRGGTVPFSSLRSVQHDDVVDDIELLLSGLAEDGFDQVVAVDLTRPETGVPVVRVVVPRAEAWNVFYVHARRSAIGGRVAGAQQRPLSATTS